MRAKALAPPLCSLLLVVGCSGADSSVREVEIGLGTASAIGRSAALGACGITWSDTSCVSSVQGCASYPCGGDVEVTLGHDCPLPLGGEASGAVSVTGQWTTEDNATLAQLFTKVRAAGQSDVAVTRTTSVSSTRSGSMITIQYAGAVAETRAGVGYAAAGGSDSWTITVDTRGTLEASDDQFTIDVTKAAAAAGVGGAAKVVSMSGVVLDPGCRQNPIAGKAQITEVQTLVPSIVNITFHAACDGRAEVNGKPHTLHFFP
jgi:hypothetical protein